MKAFKNFLTVLFFLSACLFARCGNMGSSSAASPAAADTGTAKIVFKEYEHHFGKVSEGEKLSYVFRFENQGTGALLITAATASCGCTVPKFDKKPIAPGGSGNIEVVFNTAGKSGMQTKTISIRSNARPPVTLLKITAEVAERK
jgi:hypothetical protein